MSSPLCQTLGCIAALISLEVLAQQPSPEMTAPADAANAAVKQPLRMDAPMQTGMMKDDMKQGDVKKASEREDTRMKAMLEQEEKTMPPADPGKPASP